MAEIGESAYIPSGGDTPLLDLANNDVVISAVYAGSSGGGGGGSVTVEEADGSPSVAASKIIVPNGALSVSGSNATLKLADVLIESGSLSSAQADIVISSIPSGFRALKLLLSVRGTDSAAQRIVVQPNSDSASSSYRGDALAVQGTVVSSANNKNHGTLCSYLFATGSSSLADSFSILELEIFDYDDTSKLKRSKHSGSYLAADATNGEASVFGSCTWLSTAAITSLRIALAAGNLAAGTEYSLYGLY